DYGPTGSLLRQIDKTYVTSSSFTDAHIWGRPLSETISPSGDQIAQTQWEYDTETLVSRSGTIPGWTDQLLCHYDMDDQLVCLPRANVTKIKRWLNTNNSYLTTTQQYDVLGNVVRVTDPGSHDTTI